MNQLTQPGASMPAKKRDAAADEGRSQRRAVVVIGVVAVLFGFLLGRFNPLLSHAASVEGASVDILFSVLLGVAGTIFAIVEGGLIYSIIKFRHRGDEDDEEQVTPTHGHLGLEVLWTAIPAVLVTATAIGSYFVLAAIETPKPTAMTVEVTAFQFGWQFNYTALDVKTPELRVPVGQQVLLKLHSRDVIHQFWVPAYRIKKDVMPDRVTELRFTAQQEGTFPIVCTKICGVGHSVMRSNVVAMKANDFDAWLAQQANGGALVTGGQASDPQAKGRSIFQDQGCNGCHQLSDAKSAGGVGPSLNKIGTRSEAEITNSDYKGQAKNGQDYIHESIVSPNTYVVSGFPANVMPQDYGKRLSQDDLNALVQYLSAQK